MKIIAEMQIDKDRLLNLNKRSLKKYIRKEISKKLEEIINTEDQRIFYGDGEKGNKPVGIINTRSKC